MGRGCITSDKHLKAMYKSLIRQGCELVITNNNHVKCITPSGEVVFMPKSPSDHRAYKNLRSLLRKYDLHV